IEVIAQCRDRLPDHALFVPRWNDYREFHKSALLVSRVDCIPLSVKRHYAGLTIQLKRQSGG
ncbi:MAG: hypothetical protein ACK4P1_04940, partial [Aggregatilineales bacterium]